ncbi:YciI family protein [Mycolicibacterium sp. 050158]|uniref:YciI family protein n=1 Tax=Mycolicibacterium sp. 050158 TaxID=3090602 RepID=UPI00299E9F06|nr:YciI family protein [Mycolicibacterium sp. 050158]MDX1889051.1 YciI family protein [Mycolicibacterium sp. 050158]
MFHILTLTYVRPADAIDRARPAHLEWLEEEVAAGRLILTGRLESADGGVLITSDLATAEAEDVIARDPYTVQGLVRYERVGFTAGRRAPGL